MIVWEVDVVRYRDSKTGRFVSRAVVLEYTRASIAASGEVVGTLGTKFKADKLSPKEFGALFKQEIKDEFIRQYLTGRGGLGSMTQSDWGRVGRAIQTQYKFADKFIGELSDLSEAAIINRANLYIKAAGNAFELGQREAYRKSSQFSEEYWQLSDTEHCPDCIDLNAKGWVKIGELPTVPRAGNTQCLSNCACSIIYR
jgi:hypothetical protein